MKFTDTFIHFVLDDLRNFAEANQMVQLEKTLDQLLHDQKLQHSIMEGLQKGDSPMAVLVAQKGSSALIN